MALLIAPPVVQLSGKSEDLAPMKGFASGVPPTDVVSGTDVDGRPMESRTRIGVKESPDE